MIARRLAENGCEVLVPVLINRQDTGSGNPRINRQTNLPHREWIYRQSYPLGRHIIGYEVQKVEAAVDEFNRRYNEAKVTLFATNFFDRRIGAEDILTDRVSARIRSRLFEMAATVEIRGSDYRQKYQ